MENLELKNIDFENVVIDKENNRALNIETGEIYDKDSKNQVIHMIEEKRKKDKILDAKEKELEKLVDIDEKRQFNWKKDSQFVQIYRTELRAYNLISELNPDEGLFLYHIQSYIRYETNKIAYPDNTPFNNKDFQELTGLGRDKLEKVLNSLEKKLYIKRVGKGKAREIYFNPYLSCSGNEVLKSTIKLFNGYDPITAY